MDANPLHSLRGYSRYLAKRLDQHSQLQEGATCGMLTLLRCIGRYADMNSQHIDGW